MSAHILIVDDEPDMLELLGMIITDKTSHRVTTAGNPLEAIELFRKHSYNLVIADLKMPEMNGIELTQAVKKIREDTAVIMITAYGSVEYAVEAMHKGAFDFITKPFKKDQILLTIDRALQWQQMKQENIRLKEELSRKKGEPQSDE